MTKERIFDSENEATAELKMWQDVFPKVKTAYRPSGKFPLAALLWMGAAALLGAPVLAFSSALGCVVLSFLVGGLSSAVAGSEIGVGIAIMVGLFTLPYFVVGGTSMLISGAAHLGKSRNTRATAIIAGLAGLISCAISFAVVGWIMGAFAADESFSAAGRESVQSAARFLSALVILVPAALGIASFCAYFVPREIREDVFCETCGKYPTGSPCKISLMKAEQVAQKLGDKELTAGIRVINLSPAIALSYVDPRLGLGVIGDRLSAITLDTRTSAMQALKFSLTLLRCPLCGGGYAQMEVAFEGTFIGRGGVGKMSKTWLVASRACSKEETEVLAA
jgi:hypothetical protein